MAEMILSGTTTYSVESAILYVATAADVVTTMVEGRILMRDRRLLTIDLELTRARPGSIECTSPPPSGGARGTLTSSVRGLRGLGVPHPRAWRSYESRADRLIR